MTPAVRRLAREHSVDLGRVPGTGFAGRVTRDDVLGYVAANGNGSGPAAALTPVAPAPAPAAPSPAGPSVDYLKPLTKIRRAIAAQMTRAAAVPTAYETVEVDMSSVVRLRDKLKRDYSQREGMGLSFVAFVTKAAVEGAAPEPGHQRPLHGRGPLGPPGHQHRRRGRRRGRPDGAGHRRRGPVEHQRPQPGRERPRRPRPHQQAQGE